MADPNDTPAAIKKIPLELIEPSPYQARKDFDTEDLENLADSMKEEGLLQPILVRPSGGKYQLIAGERRYRAAKILNWPDIDGKVVQTVSEGEAAAKGVVENLQRKDLNPIEEAEGFDILNKLDKKYWDQPQIAKVCGKSQEYISLSLKMLNLADPAKESIRRRILSRSHALEIMRLPVDQQAEVATKAENLSSKQTRQLVNELLEGSKAVNHAPRPADPLGDTIKLLHLSKDLYPERGDWSVRYSADKEWTIKASTQAENAPLALAKWLQKLGLAIEKQITEDAHFDKAIDMWEPANQDEETRMESERQHARLPKTPAEQAEVEALAAQGPAAVYIWVFGQGSLLAKKAGALRWADLGAADPVSSCRNFLTNLRDYLKFVNKEKQI